MKKRICSICLALALLAANQMALASELTLSGDVSVPPEIAAIVADEPLISVSVPTSGWVVVNPYRMEIARDGVVSREEIVSPVLTLENQSEVPVRVDAHAVGTISAESEAVFVQAPPAKGAADKELFLYAEFQPLAYAGAEASWLGAFRDASNQLLVTSSGLAKSGVMSLEAAGSPYSLGAMHIFGSLAASPERPWQKADSFSVTVAFTFTAAVEALPTSGEWTDTDFDAALGQSSDTVFEEDSAFADEPLPNEPFPDEFLPDETLPDGTIIPDADLAEPEDFPESENLPEPENFPGSEEPVDADISELAAPLDPLGYMLR